MKITYLNLLNAFHANQLPAQIGPLETSLFKGLLHLANQLGFKQEWLKFPNSSVQNASGIIAPATFFRARKSLISFKFNGDFLVKYKRARNTRDCGEYWICYDSLVDSLPDWSQNDNNLIVKAELNRSDPESKSGVKPQTYIDKIRSEEKRNDHDQASSQNENGEKQILTGTTASDHTIILGAIMRKWGSQIIHQPPLAQVTAALQEHARETLLEAIERAPLVLKEPDRMKLVGFIIAVAEHPMWYLDKADVLEIQTEEAKERAKEKRLVEKCETSLRSALRDGAESEIYGYIRFLARHKGEEELTTFGTYCPSLTKPLDYYQSIWDDPGSDAYE